jgi:hypothetical protein
MAISNIVWPFGIFYAHLAYFMGIWYILWAFCILYGRLVYFSRFGMLYEDKSGNPAAGAISFSSVSRSNKPFKATNSFVAPYCQT